MSQEPVRVGLIGAGFISDYHLSGLQEAGADVVTICSRTGVTAREKAKQFSIPRVAADYREVLAQDEVEAVVIVTPDFTHETLAVAAAEAGKAILLQKPMARSVEECERILEAAEKAGVLLCVSWMHRYFAEVGTMRAFLSEETLGRVHTIRQRNATPGKDSKTDWFFSREKVGGGMVQQLGVHGIDLIRLLFGEIEAVSAVIAIVKTERVLADGTVVKPDNEDTALVTYRLASGALAVHEITCNEVAGTDRFRMEIYGERGTAWLRTEKGPLALYAPDNLDRAGWYTPELPTSLPGPQQHRHFLAMVRGQEPPDSSGRDGLAAARIVETIYRSAESGQWEEVRLR